MRVLVADGVTMERRAIVDALTGIEDTTIVATVAQLDEALGAISELIPDVVIIGASVAGGDARCLVGAVRRDLDGPRVVVVGLHAARRAWRPYLAAGAIQFVDLDRGFTELAVVVRGMARWLERTESLVQVIASASHDLAVYADATATTIALAAASPADDQLRRDARGAVAQTQRLATALSGYLRGEPCAASRVELGAMVHATVGLVARSTASPVQVRVHVGAEPAAVIGYASELEQMILNLVLTVRAWIPDHGRLDIHVAGTAHEVRIELSSVGGDRRTTSTPRSIKTGSLGVVRRILHRHGGTLTVAPRTEGASTIRVSIPTPELAIPPCPRERITCEPSP